MRSKVIAFVMAGGRGTRLEPLTEARSKPAVPFGGKYRIIDFVLSNLVNSGIYGIYVLTQFKSQSLTEHLQVTWNFNSILPHHFIIPVPAQQRTGDHWYKGTADAVFQNLNLIRDKDPDTIAVFGGDHIFKMAVDQMIADHAANTADCTIAAIPVPIAEANQFGVIQVDAEWRIIGFQEKPANPTAMPGNPKMALVSMGNYIFGRDVLVRNLSADAQDESSSHDFGKNVLPKMLADGQRLFAYDYTRNRIPGSSNPANDSYWRDVGTLDAYYEANMDLRAVEPMLDLYNRQWLIRSQPQDLPPAKFVHNAEGRVGQAMQSIICYGSIVSGATVVDSIIGPSCRLNSYSEVTACVLTEDVEVGRGAHLRRCIIDKHVRIPPGDRIGFDPELDRKRFAVTEDGIVLIGKNQKIELPS